MPMISVTTEDGKNLLIAADNIATCEVIPGTPAKPAVEAADEVPDDPGEPASGANPGRAPKKGTPKIEAAPAEPAVQDKAVLTLKVGGTVTVFMSAATARAL